MWRPVMAPGGRPSNAPFLAVVGSSARMLAQSARRAGLNVAALDIFGDRDTRQYAPLWFDIGGEDLSIDRARLFDALERTARLPRMLGFVMGSGLESLAEELSRTSGLPRFIGNAAEATAAVRDPRRFFALLDRLGIAHPQVSWRPPADSAGWLLKRANGCGGMHVRLASQAGVPGTSPPTDGYFQRVASGRSMSALFVGARRQAAVIGFAEQLSTAAGDLPYLHTGSIGPIDLPPAISAAVKAAIGAIVSETGLTGLNSLDFLLDGDRFQVLEINARPSSTMTLYETAAPQAWPRGLIGCHLDACFDADLPSPGPTTARSRAGQRVVFAPCGFVVSRHFSDACFSDPFCHDVPQPGMVIGAGEPVCTLVVAQPSLPSVREELARREALLFQRMETCHEDTDDVIRFSA
jgi:predicted ATP-grasp superfamily ATP-dependent carboligase